LRWASLECKYLGLGLEVCAASDSLCEDLALVVELEREAAEGVLEPLGVWGVEFGV
jgi:hypothetical protein